MPCLGVFDRLMVRRAEKHFSVANSAMSNICGFRGRQIGPNLRVLQSKYTITIADGEIRFQPNTRSSGRHCFSCLSGFSFSFFRYPVGFPLPHDRSCPLPFLAAISRRPIPASRLSRRCGGWIWRCMKGSVLGCWGRMGRGKRRRSSEESGVLLQPSLANASGFLVGCLLTK